MASNAETIRLPSEDEDMSDAGLEGQPKRKKQIDAENMTLAIPPASDAPPAWIEQFQMALRSEVRDINNSVAAFGGLLQRESEDRRRDISEVNKRLDELTGRIDAVSKGSGSGSSFNAVPPPAATMPQHSARASGSGSSFHAVPPRAGTVPQHSAPATGPPADPWAQYLGAKQGPSSPSPSSGSGTDAQDSTDFCHIVVGGWEHDTPKRQIQDALNENLLTGIRTTGWQLSRWWSSLNGPGPVTSS